MSLKQDCQERVPRLDSGDRVRRFDVATIGSRRTTPQGFVQVTARLTRTGVLEYRDASGTVRRELRLDEEVFRPASLSTLSGAPVTDMHKGGMVTPDNVRELQVGHVGYDVRRDGRFVEATLTIQDRAAITLLEKGERREVSAGYDCHLDATPGEFEGQRYDAVQRGIVYNHVAIGPANWGRAGGDVAIRLDGADGLSGETLAPRLDAQLGIFIQQQMELLNLRSLDLARELGIDEFRLQGILHGFDQPTRDEIERIARRLDITPDRLRALIPEAERRDRKEKLPMKKVTIHLDGVDFEVELPEALAEDFAKRFKRSTQARDEAVVRADGLQVKLDASEKLLGETKGQLEKVSSPAHIQERIRARVELEGRAHAVLGAEEKFDGKSDLELMQLAIAKAEPTFKLDGKNEDSLRGLFELIGDKAKAGTPPPVRRGDGGVGDARRAIDKGREDGGDADDPRDATAAKKRFDERSRKAWQEPLSTTKDTQQH